MAVKSYESLASYHDDLERQFQMVDNEYESAQKAYNHIISALDRALATQDADLCLPLISYIESDEGFLAHRYYGDIRRLYTILHIIELEKKAGNKLFFFSCHNWKCLLEKYMLTLFALRRLALVISDASAKEAVSYLLQAELSVFAIHLIIQKDLILPEISLYEKIIDAYSGVWSKHEVQQLLYLVAHCLVSEEDECHE